MNLILEDVEPKYVSLIQELAKTLDFHVRTDAPKRKLKRPLTAKQQEFVNDMKEALHEVELHQQGKIKLQTFEEMLNEL